MNGSCPEGQEFLSWAVDGCVNVCYDVFLQDPQFMEQALTNALLMDAVVGCLQTQKAIFAATKLAYFDKKKLEGVYQSLGAVLRPPIHRFLTVAL